MSAIFNILIVVVITNLNIINGKIVTSNKGENLDIFEGVQYQLFNKDSGKQLIHADPESSKRKSTLQYEQNPYAYKSQRNTAFDDQTPQYLIFWPINKQKNVYELLFISTDHSHKKRFLVTIEKSALNNFYVLREHNPVANATECPLMQQPDGCGIFDCRQMGDLQLWDPQLNTGAYQTATIIKEFQLVGNVSEEFEKKRSKLTVIDGEIINNPRHNTLDHFVPNFLWIDDIRERVSVEFEPEFANPLITRINSQSYRIDLKVPGIRANNTKSLRKNFHFESYGNSDRREHSKYYTHVSLHRITVGPLECIEYHSFANVIDRAVLPFKATAEITASGPYGPLGQHSTKFCNDFIRSLIETNGFKLANGTQLNEFDITSVVEGKLTTTIVLRFSYSIKTITGDPICDDI